METIELPIGVEGEFTSEQFKELCKHFGIDAIVVTRKQAWQLRTLDSANFFWLGLNMNFKYSTNLSESISSKILKRKK